MSGVTWSIRRDRASATGAVTSTTKTLEQWQIVSAVRRLVSLERDTLDLLQSVDLDAEDDFANGDILRLFRDEVQVFMGRVLKPSCTASASSEQRATLVAGPWWYAESAVCTQDWTGGPELLPITTMIGTFFVEHNGAGALQIGAEIAQMVNRLTGLSAPWTAGLMDARGTPPPQLLRNVTYAEAIHAALEPVPDIVGWFDYTTGNADAVSGGIKPTFHLRDPDMIEVLTLDVTEMTDLEVARHDDDAVPYVLIQLEVKTPFNAVGADGEVEVRYRSDYENHQWPGNAVRSFGGVEATFEKTDPMDNWSATDFARRCYEAFSGLLWRGQFTLHGQECDERVRPGKRVNITGGQTAWETMDGIIQEVTHDIASGVTTGTFGPPLQSGPSDLLQRLINLRRLRAATNDNLRDRDSGYTAGTGENDEEKNEGVANGNTKAVLAIQVSADQFQNMIVRLPKRTATWPYPGP